jgi:signal transduction histidine kinase
MLLRANRQGLGVNHLAENAKALSRLRREGKPADPVRLRIMEVLRRSVETLRALHFDRAFDVSLDGPAEAEAAGVAFLENVFLNLLDAVIRRSPAGSRPSIRVKVRPEDGGVRVTIEEASHLAALIPGLTGDSGQPSTGTGMGLAAAREIVRQAGGTIEADGPGLQLVVCLPAPLPKK